MFFQSFLIPVVTLLQLLQIDLNPNLLSSNSESSSTQTTTLQLTFALSCFLLCYVPKVTQDKLRKDKT
jgi:hypothetical protein